MSHVDSINADRSTVRTVAVLQSNYIPWRGYFGILAACDVFIILDSVQSTKNDWRNRNRIRTANGECWLTIPVHHSSALRIREVRVAGAKWAETHWRTIMQAYRKAPFYAELHLGLECLYQQAREMRHLSEINRLFIDWVAAYLQVNTKIVAAKDLIAEDLMDRMNPTERIVALCKSVCADRYVSGPSARSYIDAECFRAANVSVAYANYSRLGPYVQLRTPFVSEVSILDTLLMNGKSAAQLLDLGFEEEIA